MHEYTEQQILDMVRLAYTFGTATFAIVPKNCALLVIDMQDEFVKPGWSPYWVPAATEQIPRVKEVITHCHERNIPVIYTVFSRTHDNLDRPASGEFMANRYPELGIDQSEYFVKGNIWFEIAPLKGDIVIHKPSYGAFYDTPLETILRNLGKDTIIIAGTLTNFCCGMTARQGYERGFKVIFGSDITATDDPDLQEPELQVLRKGFARVLSAEEIIAALE